MGSFAADYEKYPATDAYGNVIGSTMWLLWWGITYEEYYGTSRPSAAPATTPAQPIYKEEQRNSDMAVYQNLDVSQSIATPGQTLPIIFGRRVNDIGGVWFSPQLVSIACYNFELTYLYVACHGEIDEIYTGGTHALMFIGKRNRNDLLVNYRPTLYRQIYTDDSTVCPADIGTLNMSCDGTTLKYFGGELGVETSSKTEFKTYGNYVTDITLRIRTCSFGTTTSERYTIVIARRDNITGTTTTQSHTIGGADGHVDTISYTGLTASNFSFVVDQPALDVDDTNGEIFAFLIEVEQTQTPPTSDDYTAEYVNTQFYGISFTNMSRLDDSVTYKLPSGDEISFASKLPLQNRELKQLHLFANGALKVPRWSDYSNNSAPIGPSNMFLDLVFYVLLENKQMEDVQILQQATKSATVFKPFHTYYKMFFNGAIYQSTNLISYLQQVSVYFLMSFSSTGIYWSFEPLLPLDANNQIDDTALTPVMDFTDLSGQAVLGTITAGTYQKQFKDGKERLPFVAVMVYREQNPTYPEPPKTVKVRYSDQTAEAPEELYDLSEFCCNRDHAIIVAKYLLAVRRYETTMVQFETARNVKDLKINDLFSTTLSRTNSDGDDRIETEHYLLVSKTYTPGGTATITGRGFPLDPITGAGIIPDSIVNGSFEVTSA